MKTFKDYITEVTSRDMNIFITIAKTIITCYKTYNMDDGNPNPIYLKALTNMKNAGLISDFDIKTNTVDASTVSSDDIQNNITKFVDTILYDWQTMSQEAKTDPWYKRVERQACVDIFNILRRNHIIKNYNLKGITY